MNNILYFCLSTLFLASCSISYVKQENIYHSDIEVTTPHDHKNNVDVAPPSLGKDIVKGVRTIANVAEAVPRAREVPDAERARRDAA